MPQHIPVSGAGPTPEPPPYGGLGEAGWARGKTFLELVEDDKEARAELEAAYAALDVDEDTRTFFTRYPRRVRVLVLGDLAHVDTRVNVAQAERLFALGDSIWMRVFAAAENLDLVRIFVGAQYEMPLFVLFGDERREFARWGPRPRALQELQARRQPPDPQQSEAQRLDFYRQDRGRALASELRERLEPRLGG
jgi:hypothetical protein